ncbi:ATP-binding cassette domain-containing protein [Kordiimonas sp. SCSIO 12603]|uniref:ABC transporter ATP-binding protein n=1 Tax=Kordiimonas sp. SCSIO 12603 TaxID=2829596 RepID=UPI0021055CF6|nr:ATP-binding cassette domain-containing protein [Kordiimonas sp. SCSIO 12603]UTW57370.1 ATP-binding cassette domain-containing protein [Kordiimonas sp. SCSIO 12603]
MLNLLNVGFSYDNTVNILSDLCLSVEEGEVVALLGPSGCGKSTLLRLISGLLEPSSGSISYDGKRDTAFVFQEPSLMPWATVEANVKLPLKLKNNIDNQLIADALEAVELAGFEKRFPEALSGGQKMRVSIARALVAQPDILLLDEPFAALDEILRFQMNNLILNLQVKNKLTVLFVTHSIYEAAYLADRVFIMKDGMVSGEVAPQLDRSLKPDEQRTSIEFMNAAKQIAEFLAGEVV